MRKERRRRRYPSSRRSGDEEGGASGLGEAGKGAVVGRQDDSPGMAEGEAESAVFTM